MTSILASNQNGVEMDTSGLVKELVKELAKGLVKELTENQMKLLELIEANPSIIKEEMAEHLKISTTAVDKNIKTLKQKGLLERVGGRKEGFWRIISPTE